MIDIKDVKDNISVLLKHYRSTQDIIEPFLFSKTALLELCGWIELAIDDIFGRYAKKYLDVDECKKCLDAIDNIHAFSYEYHLKKIGIQLVGRIGFAELESCLGEQTTQQLRNLLNSIYSQRIENAHAYIDIRQMDRLKKINAPDMTLKQLDEIYELFKNFEEQLESIY